MRIGSIRLKNYIGIYNGMGLDELYIDFSKSKHSLTLIKGSNGSGKSTLLNALSPFPDDNASFVQGKPAEKELIIYNGDIYYEIRLVHGVNGKGERDTTKAYITKVIGNERINLNPNGNVSSYKEILHTEFSLDPNYISLSRLSMDDKGLVDKTPSERKKFVNNVLDSLTVYNNIHKTLSKRSSIFKSMINNLTSKIEYLGDSERLKLDLENLNTRIENLTKRKDSIIESIASNKTFINVIDPDSSIQDTYNTLVSELQSLENQKNEYLERLNARKLELNISQIDEDFVYSLHKSITDEINELTVNIQIAESEINVKLNERESQYRILEAKTEKLRALNNNMNYDDLKSSIKECKKNIERYENVFKKLNIDNPENISADEYLTALDALTTIKNSIDIFKSFASYDVILKSVELIKSGQNLDLITLEDQINGIKESIENNKQELKFYEGLMEMSKKVELRPKDCKISNCLFIKDSLEALKQEPEKNIIRLSEEIESNETILSNLMISKDNAVEIMESCAQIKNILRGIQSYSRILAKFPVKNILLDEDSLLERLQTNNDFNEIRILSEYQDLANIFEQYKYEKDRIVTLENSLKVFESKIDVIGLIENEISELNSGLNELTELISSKSEEILENKKSLKQKNELLTKIDVLIDIYSGLSEIEKNSNLQKSEYSAIRGNMNKINDALGTINNLNGELEALAVELNDLIKDRDVIKHSVSLLKDYEMELEGYRNSYNKIETIKEYSSPNKGIQLLFIEIYMNKILSLSNDLLSLLFEGKFELQPFVINEKEFRIPCKGSGLLNDDISSMSASERCLISMIISFSLLFQASTKYNILCLDEIDSPLDSSNRLQFLNVLERQIEILQIEQTFMISHNSEVDMSDVDLIVLKSNETDYDDPSLNIIYRYQ